MWLLEQDHGLTPLKDRNEVGFNQMSRIDVYNFLPMVNNTGRTNSNTACLGEEVDDLMEVDEVADCWI